MAVKAPPAAARAVTDVRPAGTGSAESIQLAPPLDELAANGTGWPVVVTRGADGGHGAAGARDVLQHGPGGADRKGQVGLAPGPAVRRGPGRRLVAVRAHRDEAGRSWPPRPVICRAPGPSSAPAVASPARCQPVRLADHQAAATVRPETTWPFWTCLTF